MRNETKYASSNCFVWNTSLTALPNYKRWCSIYYLESEFAYSQIRTVNEELLSMCPTQTKSGFTYGRNPLTLENLNRAMVLSFEVQNVMCPNSFFLNHRNRPMTKRHQLLRFRKLCMVTRAIVLSPVTMLSSEMDSLLVRICYALCGIHPIFGRRPGLSMFLIFRFITPVLLRSTM